MAERGLFVRHTGDGQYDQYLSRWAGTDRAVTAICDGTHPLDLPTATWHPVTSIGFDELVESTDYLGTEALYRENNEETTVFLPLWFGLPLPDGGANRNVGALVSVRSLPDARAVRSQFWELKGVLADRLRDGSISPPVPPLVLRAAIFRLTGRERYLSITDFGAGNLSGIGRPDTP